MENDEHGHLDSQHDGGGDHELTSVLFELIPSYQHDYVLAVSFLR